MSDEKQTTTTVTTVQTLDADGNVISETKTTVETTKPDTANIGQYL